MDSKSIGKSKQRGQGDVAPSRLDLLKESGFEVGRLTELGLGETFLNAQPPHIRPYRPKQRSEAFGGHPPAGTRVCLSETR